VHEHLPGHDLRALRRAERSPRRWIIAADLRGRSYLDHLRSGDVLETGSDAQVDELLADLETAEDGGQQAAPAEAHGSAAPASLSGVDKPDRDQGSSDGTNPKGKKGKKGKKGGKGRKR
jgi:hypothetical protein